MKKIFRKNIDYILFIFTVFLFVFICGYSEAGIKKIPDLPNSATIQNNDLLVFENLSTNKTNNIKFSDLVSNFPIPNLNDLFDVNISSPANNDVLFYNGLNWVNTPISAIAPINNIYQNDGILSGNRVLDGDNYLFDLSLIQISNFGIEANELSLYANNNATIESNGNLNLLANENLTGGVAKNTDLRSIPDWDLTGDLSGRIYSGNDVLDLSSTPLAANARGTGFFNKRTSNNVSHYLFAGDLTGSGGTADEVSIGINDLGLTPLSVEFGLVRDSGAGQPSHRLLLDSATAYYHMDVATESNLNETFANTGFTAQRFSDINESRYEYLSNNHHYALKFSEAGGQYLELHNNDTFGPENSYTRMFRTNIQSNVSDGILSNGTTLNLTGFNIYTLPQYANVSSEKIVVRDDVTGDLKDSLRIDRISRKKNHVIIGSGAGYTANLDEFVIFQGANTGAYTGEILTLPNPVLDGDTITIKVKTNDVLRIDGAGYLIDGNSTFDIDGTIISGQQPSVTLEYDLTLNEWQVI